MFAPLELEEIDTDLYRTKPETLWRPIGARGVYGGQVIGQALVAATKTVPESYIVHSLHSYFLLPGNYEIPILYRVDRLRDGKSFMTRSVVASQKGKAIFTCQISFQVQESGFDYQIKMPDAPTPDTLLSEQDRIKTVMQKTETPDILRQRLEQKLKFPVIFDVRYCPRSEEESKGRLIWLKVNQTLSDDMAFHRCIIAFAADMYLLSTSFQREGERERLSLAVSLDHTMWFHSPSFRADEWMLYEMENTCSTVARALCVGRLWTREGKLAVSVNQEGLVRLKSKQNPKPKL